MTTRDIQRHLEEIYGVDVSASLISQVTDAINEEVILWQNRPLDEVYPIVYLDAVRIKVRHDSRVINKAGCYVAKNQSYCLKLISVFFSFYGGKYLRYFVAICKNCGNVSLLDFCFRKGPKW
jgi:Transposase, Mutator family